MAGLLSGAPKPSGDIPAEELYDIAHDPREQDDLAAERFDDLLEMRRRVTDWLAEYGDRPDRERFQYELDFAGSVELSIRAPRAFSLQIDGAAASSLAGATAKGTSFRLRDGERPLGVVDLGGPSRLVVRCAASGVPLAFLDSDHPRLNLALARTNCAGPASGRRPSPGEALFSSELVERRSGIAAAHESALPELKRALSRWGYVRDK
jgi:hypothetical protein